MVVAFGQLLRPSLLDAVPHGFVNVHFSLLPRWRGAAPVERAILAGDAETGVCIMRIDAGLDTGPVYSCAVTPIDDRRDRRRAPGPPRRARHATPRRDGAGRSLDRSLSSRTGEPIYAEKLTVDEFRLDAAAPGRRARPPRAGGQPAPRGVDARRRPPREGVAGAPGSRGVTPPARASSTAAGSLATAEGRLVLDEVQPEGKRAMAAACMDRGPAR